MLEGKLGEVVRLVIREVRRAGLMLVRMRMPMLMPEAADAGEDADVSVYVDAGGCRCL